jgi:hypothetical protein
MSPQLFVVESSSSQWVVIHSLDSVTETGGWRQQQKTTDKQDEDDDDVVSSAKEDSLWFESQEKMMTRESPENVQEKGRSFVRKERMLFAEWLLMGF